MKSERLKINGAKDHNKHKGKKLKLSFDELLAKYLKENDAKRANRSNDVKSSRLPPKHNSGSWNWQRKNFHSAAPYSPSGPSMPIPNALHPAGFHHHSSWGWDDPWAHTPSYFRPYHVEYAAPREPSCAGQPCVENDRFKPKYRSRVQEKKKVVKQIYVVKKDGRKATSSDLNTIAEKPINVLKTSAINGNEKENSAVDIPNTKSGQKKLKEPKIKKKVSMSKAQAQPRYLLGSSGWQKKKLQRLSAQELKEKGMAWVPKGSIQTQDEDDVCTEGAMQLKKNRRSKRRSSNIRFAPNHQNYWSVHHPFDSQMPYTPVYWNSSMNMFGYPSCSYFDPWTPCGSLYQGGLSPNCYAY